MVSKLKASLLFFQILSVQTFTVLDFKVKNGILPARGREVELECLIENFTSAVSIGINSQPALPVASLLSCNNRTCLGYVEGYIFTSGDQGIIIRIEMLNRTRDEKYWFCGGFQIFLQIYTLTSTLRLVQSPALDVDLAASSVTLYGTTDCCSPKPNITWYYEKIPGMRELWTAVSQVTGTAAGCTDKENKYTSTLILSQYTVLSSNEASSARFVCGIEDNGQIGTDLFSSASMNIRFAVRVTGVNISDGGSLLTNASIVDTVAGEDKTLTCSVSASARPPAVVFWYIGSSLNQSSGQTTFTFTPANQDHNKRIYCKAYNFNDESLSVFSAWPQLFVKVKVSSAVLKDGELVPVSSLLVQENQQKILTCDTSFSRPTPTVVWYIDNVEKQRSKETVFSFTPTNLDHGNVIYCKAFNIQTEGQAATSRHLSLYVEVPATQPTLSNKTENSLELLSGDTVTIHCLSSPTRPPVKVIWKLGNAQLTSVLNSNITVDGALMRVKSILTVTPNSSYNKQNLICETFIDSQTTRPQALQLIEVYWAPSGSSITPVVNFPWREGQTNQYLECRADDMGNPVAVASWQPALGWHVPGNSLQLHMPDLEARHNGLIVSCTLKNEFTSRKNLNVSMNITLIVEYLPIIDIRINGSEQTKVTLNEGQSLRAVCSATGNPTPESVLWGTTSTSTLSFFDISRTDDKVYNCTAKSNSLRYGQFINEKSMTVEVFYAPVVKVIVPEVLNETEQFVVTCSAFGKPETYTYVNVTQTWMDSRIQTFFLNESGKVLITKATIQNSGNYTCYVHNGITDRSGALVQSGMARVLIRGKPLVPQRTSRITAGKIGETVNISIPFYSYPEIESVTLKTPNGTDDRYVLKYTRETISDSFYDIIVNLSGYIAELVINEQEESDFGNYSLVLQNSVGTMTWMFQHVSRSIPQPPKFLVFVGFREGVPTFLLGGGFNGGMTQTFVVETAISGTSDWKERLRFDEHNSDFKLPNGSFKFNISGLGPHQYQIRVLALNELGTIEAQHGVNTFITIEGDGTEWSVGGIIGGSMGAAVAVGMIAAVLIIVWKRRFQKNDKETSKKNGKDVHENSSDDEDVEIENPMYVSAGPQHKQDATVYAKANKSTADTKSSDVYAVVKKPKAANKKKKTKQTKSQPTAEGDIYENAPKPFADAKTYGNAAFDSTPYETAEMSTKAKTNVDDLMYADLAFSKPSKGKKLVIHGLDDRTPYAQVDFTKHADPLPESDTEEPELTPKK